MALADCRHMAAYVLLGEPGSGKTSAFQMEQMAMANDAVLMTARDFVTIGPPEDSQDKVLFIDALDERRASVGQSGGPLDEIRVQLKARGYPRFRLACREADWLTSDSTLLAAVAQGGAVQELRLEPLDDDEVLMLLQRWVPERLASPDEFVRQAARRNLSSLLGNPLLLDLLVLAVRGDAWPSSRKETYLLACRHLVKEINREHQRARSARDDGEDDLLQRSGALCAVMLLNDRDAILMERAAGGTDALEVTVAELAPSLGLTERQAQAALNTRLFVAEGARRVPRHRTIAEFLAATHLAAAVQHGLPIQRIETLVSGFDGQIVEPLRGLFGWIATECAPERVLLLDRDPLAVVLYGDPLGFTTAEKQRIFRALHGEASRHPVLRYRRHEAHGFGALATADMAGFLAELLGRGQRDAAHAALVGCACEAVQFGETSSEVQTRLRAICGDPTHSAHVRQSALEALLSHDDPESSTLAGLLDDVMAGSLVDDDDQLLGLLLSRAYPRFLRAPDLPRYLHDRKEPNLLGHYSVFWQMEVFDVAPASELPALMDACAVSIRGRSRKRQADDLEDLDRFAGRVLPRALEACGDGLTAQRLYAWLDASSNRFGWSLLVGTERFLVARWLGAHPALLKALYLYAMHQALLCPPGTAPDFARCDGLIRLIERPGDWYRWLLETATTAADARLARHCFDRAAKAAASGAFATAITENDVGRWVEANRGRWAEVTSWKEQARLKAIDRQKREREQQNRQERDEAWMQAQQAQRRILLAPHLPSLYRGHAPASVMEEVVEVYRLPSPQLDAIRPLDRLQEYYGIDARVARRVERGIERTLAREDLPLASQIFGLHLAGSPEMQSLQVWLLAADLAVLRAADAPTRWSDSLARLLVACATVASFTPPVWYAQLAVSRASLVREVLLSYFTQAMMLGACPRLPARGDMVSGAAFADLAQQLLPEMLRQFPADATEDQLAWLDRGLLPAAMRHLDRGVLSDIVTTKAGWRALDPLQRLSWTVAALDLDAASYAHDLHVLVEGRRERALRLAASLDAQWNERDATMPEQPGAVGSLLEAIALAAPAHRLRASELLRAFSAADAAVGLVRDLLRHLAAMPSFEATAELSRLQRCDPPLPWIDLLDAAVVDQAALARKQDFRYAPLDAVLAVVRNGPPASARDAAVLTVHHLARIANQLRFGDENQIRQFYDDTPDGLRPKSENTCRDILKYLLTPSLLTQSISLDKEPYAANDQRGDLRALTMISGRRVEVPVEIKKSSHKAVWTAWKDQLLDAYAASPNSQGIGIYIVLWFGEGAPADADGGRAADARDMARMFSERIDRSSAARLYGLVVDLSPTWKRKRHS